MRKFFYLATVFVISIAVVVAHLFAVKFSWYWKWWWFDILMHFLGGLCVSMAFLWLSRVVLDNRREGSLFAAAVFVLLVGGAWETFEFVTKNTFTNQYLLDTCIDFLMDLVGGVFAFFVFDFFKIKAEAE